MKLLKIGGFNICAYRWYDAYETFNDIFVIDFKNNNKKIEKVKYFYLNENENYFNYLLFIVDKISKYKHLNVLTNVIIIIIRFFYKNKIIDFLNSIEYDEVHVSYNDFDHSSLLLIIIYPFLDKKIRITRSYKESRPEYNYIEKRSFELSDRIVLNEKENLFFFINKYGKRVFENKDIIIGIDEDYIGSIYIKGFKRTRKLSEIDGKKHAVILASYAHSDCSDKRSGSRLYYIPLIKKLLDVGIVVHLHALHFVNDKNGINQYIELEKKENNFHIEDPLDFIEDGWKKAYMILSSYDYGVMHNYIKGTSNTIFDKYNIPHRYYEYLIAGVIPILKADETYVLERIIKENRTGIIYGSEYDLLMDYKIDFKQYRFADYINRLYSKK